MAKDYRHSFSDWFPSRRRSVNPKPSPRQQALLDRLSALKARPDCRQAVLNRVGGRWIVSITWLTDEGYYNGVEAQCANLAEVADAVEEFEQVAKEG